MGIRELGQPGDLGWVVQIHGEVYAAEYGFDGRFEALVARVVADYVPGRDRAWIASVDGVRVGSIFCVAGPDDTAVLRLLLVTPGGRGLGLGGQLVDTCIAFARSAGYRRLRLWTNDPLTVARKLYESRGFTLDSAEPFDGFGIEVTAQTYILEL